MISCKRATELMSKSMEERLSFKEEISLKIHLFICEFCEQFKNQIVTLRNALRAEEQGSKLDLHEESQCQEVLSSEAKERIKKTIDQLE